MLQNIYNILVYSQLNFKKFEVRCSQIFGKCISHYVLEYSYIFWQYDNFELRIPMTPIWVH